MDGKNLQIACMYIKLIAKFRNQDVSNEDCKLLTEFILENIDQFTSKDVSSLVLAVAIINKIDSTQLKPLFDKAIEMVKNGQF